MKVDKNTLAFFIILFSYLGLKLELHSIISEISIGLIVGLIVGAPFYLIFKKSKKC